VRVDGKGVYYRIREPGYEPVFTSIITLIEITREGRVLPIAAPRIENRRVQGIYLNDIDGPPGSQDF